MKFSLILFLAIVVGCSTKPSSKSAEKQNYIAEMKVASEYLKIESEIQSHIKTFGPKNVLVVFDVDNTLLKNNIEVGSEQWFYWQDSLMKTNSKQKVADTFSGLLNVQGLLFDLDPMKLTDDNVDEVITRLQASGVKTIVLTSRGSAYRSTTERTLLGNGIDFSKTKIGYDVGGSFLPYNLNKLTKEEKEMVGSRAPSETSYVNGIFMTSGQHKGLMLKSLLEKFDFNPSLIVFIDNHEKQVTRVHDTFKGNNNVIVYRFSGMDKVYESFNDKKKQDKADRDWRKIKRFIEDLYKVKI
jgi:hypothetical protein